MFVVKACVNCGRTLYAVADENAPRCPAGTCPVRFFAPHPVGPAERPTPSTSAPPRPTEPTTRN